MAKRKAKGTPGEGGIGAGLGGILMGLGSLGEKLGELAGTGGQILPNPPNLPIGLPGVSDEPNDGLPLKELTRRTIVIVERAALTRVLRKTRGNKAKAARLLQIDYKTIHLKVKEYGIAAQGGDSDG